MEIQVSNGFVQDGLSGNFPFKPCIYRVIKQNHAEDFAIVFF